MSLVPAFRILAALVAIICATAQAKTVYVSTAGNDASDGKSWATAKKTVQAGLNAAAPGDQVWVAAGTYVERITLVLGVELYGGFAGTEKALGKRDWVANRSILDGNKAGSVVRGPAGATATTRIDGFTIRNGGTSRGGGLYLSNSSPTIANNTITGNSVTGTSGCGGGLYLSNSSPTITNNTVTNNSAPSGGGLYLSYSAPTITNNTIAGNDASSGGGLYLGSSSPTITNNTITGNNAYDGGGLYLSSSAPTITNNTIAGNDASSGGGLYLGSSSSPTITNNIIKSNYGFSGGGLHLSNSFPTIANNTITSNSAYDGGGLYLISSSPTIANNTIVSNNAYDGGGLCLGSSSPTIANTIVAFNSSGIRQYGSGGTPTLRCNCVYGNGTHDYSGLTDPTGTNGNIKVDPKLAGFAYGNLHLQPDSPCIDTGSDSDVQTNWLDMDGEPRRIGQVDIGTDESDGTAWTPGPNVVVRVSPVGDDTNDGSSWALAKRTVQAGVDAAAAQAGDVWVATGTYCERVTLHQYVHLYGGFAGGETQRAQRNWAANVAILDGLYRGPVVTVRAGYRVNTIDGLTVRNGNALYGGGIYLYHSSPTIANNTITGNSATNIYGSLSGGGLYLYCSYATITNNTITNNSTDNGGGGLYLSCSSPMIADNTITDNSASYRGGGLCLYSSSPMIVDNTITNNNTTDKHGTGGGLFLSSSSPTMANNTITNNRSCDGGGLYLQDSSPTITNSTITSNSAYSRGGGLYLTSSSPVIANTIVAFNSSGIYSYGAGGILTLRCNCVYGNTACDYSGLTDPTGTNGNIKVDPKLAGFAYGNLHLQPDSPCIDTGSDSDVQTNWLDMDGEPRQIGQVDIGADESDGTAWTPGPNVVVRVSPVGDDTNDGSSWALAKRTVQAGVDAAAAQAGDVWVATGTYCERVTLHQYVHLYGGFAGGETQRAQRNWAANVAILDGQQGGSVVTAPAAGHGVSTIDGFTIRNGKASYGGGLYLNSSSPTITNNTITNNSASSSGGGLYLYNSSSTITNNTIANNNTVDVYGAGGGLCVSYSYPTITNNTITGNNTSYGGGLCLGESSPTIANNTVNGNIALRYGGGMYLSYSSPRIINNNITGNSTSYYGGGLYVSHSYATIANNTIASNSASSAGSGLYLDACSPTITNTIVAFNSSGIYRNETSGLPTLRYNCVYGNTAYDYSGLTNPTGTSGNISVDPGFVQMTAPYDIHLVPGSPCIHAGDPASVAGAGETDMDGQGRVIAGRVDIGADEFCLVGDANFDGYVNVGDLQQMVAAWGTQQGDATYSPAADFNRDRYVNVGDLQLLVGNWGKGL